MNTHKLTVRTHSLLLLSSLLLLLLCALPLVSALQSGSTADTEVDPAPGYPPLLPIDTATLTGITVTRLEADTLEFCRTSGSAEWTYAENPALHLDQAKLEALVTALEALTPSLCVASPEANASYGLDTPQITIGLQDGITTHRLAIGHRSSYNGLYYCAVDDRSVYMITEDLLSLLPQSIASIALPDAFPEVLGDRIVTIEVSRKETSVRYTYHPGGTIVDDVRYYWSRTVNGGISTYLGDDSDLTLSLFCTDFVFPSPVAYTRAALAEHGLLGDDPITVTVTYRPETEGTDGPARDEASFTLYVGDAHEKGYYVSMGGALYAAENPHLSAIIDDLPR